MHREKLRNKQQTGLARTHTTFQQGGRSGGWGGVILGGPFWKEHALSGSSWLLSCSPYTAPFSVQLVSRTPFINTDWVFPIGLGTEPATGKRGHCFRVLWLNRKTSSFGLISLVFSNCWVSFKEWRRCFTSRSRKWLWTNDEFRRASLTHLNYQLWRVHCCSSWRKRRVVSGSHRLN